MLTVKDAGRQTRLSKWSTPLSLEQLALQEHPTPPPQGPGGGGIPNYVRPEKPEVTVESRCWGSGDSLRCAAVWKKLPR